MPIILGIVCKWFSFFWLLSSSSRTRARTVWSWWLWQWWFVATSHHLKHQTSPKHLITQAFGPARLARGLDNVFLAKLPPESYTRNLLWAARASELKQFDDMVTFTFQKDAFYIHTLHILPFTWIWLKENWSGKACQVGWNLRMDSRFIGPISGTGIRNTWLLWDFYKDSFLTCVILN